MARTSDVYRKSHVSVKPLEVEGEELLRSLDDLDDAADEEETEAHLLVEDEQEGRTNKHGLVTSCHDCPSSCS